MNPLVRPLGNSTFIWKMKLCPNATIDGFQLRNDRTMQRISLLIKNATVVLPEGTARTSVAVDDGKIVDIDPAIQLQADNVIDAGGLHLLPGIVDTHVHFREPGLTHKEDLQHATRACAAGGVTSFLEMPNTKPATTTCEALADKLAIASKKSLVNYGFYIGATRENLTELQNAQRTPGIKIFIGSSTGDLLVDGQKDLERIFAETTLPICAHCEDETTVQQNTRRYSMHTDVANHSLIRDHRAAVISTSRAIDLAIRHQHPFHVLHVSTADEIPLIAEAGPLVTAEVCPHHLLFSINDYARLGSLIKINPSVKNLDDCEALWQSLQVGQIQMVVTDHAPHTLEEKGRTFPECPSGMPAVENSLALMLNQVHAGRITLEQVVQWMSTNPARIWNIRGKGSIAVGLDADLVLVDLNLVRTVENSGQYTKCGWSPWDGETLVGWPVRTFVAGREVYRWTDRGGEFQEGTCGSELQFDRVR